MGDGRASYTAVGGMEEELVRPERGTILGWQGEEVGTRGSSLPG